MPDGPGGETCTPDPSVPGRVRWLLRYARMNLKNGSRRGVEPPPLGYEPWWIPDLPAVKLVETTGLAPAQRHCECRSPLWNMRSHEMWWRPPESHRVLALFRRAPSLDRPDLRENGPRRRYRADVCRLSAGCSAFELFEGKNGRGARDCTEPRSFGDSAGHWTIRPYGCRTGTRTRDLLSMSQTSCRCSILQQSGARGRYRAGYPCVEDRHVSENTSRA